jgi:hypothetical protein
MAIAGIVSHPDKILLIAGLLLVTTDLYGNFAERIQARLQHNRHVGDFERVAFLVSLISVGLSIWIVPLLLNGIFSIFQDIAREIRSVAYFSMSGFSIDKAIAHGDWYWRDFKNIESCPQTSLGKAACRLTERIFDKNNGVSVYAVPYFMTFVVNLFKQIAALSVILFLIVALFVGSMSFFRKFVELFCIVAEKYTVKRSMLILGVCLSIAGILVS